MSTRRSVVSGGLTVHLPAEPPALTPEAASVLLRILLAADAKQRAVQPEPEVSKQPSAPDPSRTAPQRIGHKADLRTQTYAPAPDAALAGSHHFLLAHEQHRHQNGTAHCLLVDEPSGQQVRLPDQLVRVLQQVAATLCAGQAVTIATESLTLTTQQAADLLHVSRPTVVKLIEAGEIPCERTSHRRSVQLCDVLAYRERSRHQP